MEIQIPLILFIAFTALSCGIFASQAVLAFRGEGKGIQLPSLAASLISLVVGGICVMFHLESPLHIFNGFGNPTSGITQELIAIVLLVIVMLVYFIMLRQKDDQAPQWCAVVAIIMAIIVDIICAHSYMMASRPAWDSILQVISIIGGSCAVGPAVVAVIDAVQRKKDAATASAAVAPATPAAAPAKPAEAAKVIEETITVEVEPDGETVITDTIEETTVPAGSSDKSAADAKAASDAERTKEDAKAKPKDKAPVNNLAGQLTFIGTIVGLATTVIYIFSLIGVSGSLSSIGNTYLDPTNPTARIFSSTSVSPFDGMALPFTIITILAAILAVVAAVLGKRKGDWVVWGAIAAISAFIAIICLRVVMFAMGYAVFNYYGITG